MKPRYSSRVELLALALVLAAAALLGAIRTAPVMAQATKGNLKGTVVDQNGAVIPEASITAKNQDTGVSTAPYRSTKDGVFAIPNLSPGTYTVTIESQNFKRAVYTDVKIQLGEDTVLSANLQPGGVTETVTVTAGAETAIQTETAQISASFETRKVAELPSNAAGGGIDTLALLAPGVVPGFGNVNSNGETLSVNGQRARSNNFTIDGTDNNDLSIGGPNLFVSNQDQVQEFQIITNNYSAQYGRNQGAVINIVTKGGTNEIHGSVFEFHRDSKNLDALDNIRRRQGEADPSFFLSNVFGATGGGPIKKDKIFFFGTYQGIRQRQTTSLDANNPAILAAEFPRLTAAFPGNNAIAAITKQNAFALTNLGTVTSRKDRDPVTTYSNGAATPAGTQDLITIGGVEYAAAFPHRDFATPFNQNEYSLRGDVNLSEKNTVNTRYIFQKGTFGNSLGGTNGFTGDIPASSRNLSGTYNRTLSSRATNELRATYQKLDVIFGGGCGDNPLTGCIPHPDQLGNAFTNISFGIRGDLTGTLLQTIGPATNLPQGRTVEVYQFNDNFSVTLGRHQIVTGVDVRRLINNVPFLPNLNGQFRFSTGGQLSANTPDRLVLGAGEPKIRYTETDQFYFFQDDWKVRENLTLNLGVRYENTGQPINVLNRLSTVRESDPNAAFYRQNLPIAARTVPKLPTDSNNIAPRIGLAYTPRVKSGLFGALLGDGATVFRGGYSIAYDPAFYNILLNVSTSAPQVFLNTISSAQAPSLTLPANPTGTNVRSQLSNFLQRNTFDPRLLNQTIVGNDFHSPYAQQYSFGIQRQINRDNVAEVRYVGSHGVGLFQSINRNPNLLNLKNGFTSAGFGATPFTFPAFPSALGGFTPLSCANNTATLDNEAACNGRILPVGLLRSRENTAFSTYHSLQTRYNGRLFKQLTVGFAYTFSKALDNASEIFGFGESGFAANPLNLGGPEKGISGFDRPHAISMNFIHDLPLFKEQKGLLGKALGGFQLNGTYIIASGRPFSVSQFSGFGFGLPSYQDNLFNSTFAGLDASRPFLSNPRAPRTAVAMTDKDASFYGFFGTDANGDPLPFVPSPTGFYSLNIANTQFDANGNPVLTPVNPNDVRYILNGPGAATLFGNVFGNVPRNYERGARLNQANFGIFKNTKFKERFNLQFRAEMFNVFNHSNSGYGVAGQDSLFDNVIEDAGTTFNDRGEATLSSRRIQFGLRFVF
jgi:outer membrane receptor protein involved in Fe transport